MNLISRHLAPSPGRQSGIALVVGLLLLVVVTLVGLAAMRGTITQHLMAANFYDRQTAMQDAEAGLRVAQWTLQNAPGTITLVRDCSVSGANCTGDPFTDPNLPANAIQTVAAGAGAGQFTPSGVAAGQPEYVVENMGPWSDPNSSTGFGQTANAAQYGAQGLSTTVTYYRITARSGDPANIGDRSVVTLQAMVKQ